jgi:DNA-directed RNA polymerase sigma subunit (sigma70/sigma32)
MIKKDGLRECSRQCMKLDMPCPHTECRLWIDYEKEHNCTLISIYENGSMTLRQIAERSGISFARVKQIETKALQKIKNINILGCFEI